MLTHTNQQIVRTRNYFIPLLGILTLVGIINAIQYYNFHTDMSSVFKFLSISAAKLLYNWFYLLLLFMLPLFYNTFVKRKYLDWWMYNILTLLLFLFFHQVVALIVDELFLGKHTPKTLSELLIDNQAVWVDIVLYILFIFALYLIEYKKALHEKELRRSQLEIQLLKSRLTELRVKIQPNFLFKTLNSIEEYLTKGNNDEANRILSLLSEFLRTNIYETDSDYSTLSEEIDFLKIYTDIENLSDKTELQLNIDSKPENSEIKVPRFLLQPIIEEIVLNSKSELLERVVNLRVIHHRDYFIVSISSNLNVDKMLIGGSTVIKFTKDRLSGLYGNKNKFLFKENDGDLFEIVIELPCEIPDREELLNSGE